MHVHTNVMRERAWLICHTFSSSYSSRAAWNCAGVKPRDTQRCSASAIRTDRAEPSPASSRSREKITSAGRCALEMRHGQCSVTLIRNNLNGTVVYWIHLIESVFLCITMKLLWEWICIERWNKGDLMCSVYLVLLLLSACSESLLISISRMASLTSSFSTTSTIRKRA